MIDYAAPPTHTKALTLSEVLRFLRRGAPLALATMLAASVAAAFVTRGMEPVYRASVSVISAHPPAAFGTLELVAPPQLDPQVYQSALLQGTVIQDAILQVSGTAPSLQQVEDFKKRLRISVDSQPVSSVIRIDVDDTSPDGAADYANAIANQLVSWDRNRARQFIESTITALEQAIVELDAQLVAAIQVGGAEAQARQTLIASLRDQRARELEAARARQASAVVVGSLTVLAPAAVPPTAIGPRLVFNTFIAAVLGLVFGYGAQLVRWSMRDEVSSKQKLGELTGLPVLADFPTQSFRRSRAAGEAASFLRANLLRELPARGRYTVGITSVSEYSEKAGVAVALAEKLANSGFKTLLVDGDLRKQGPGVGVSAKGTKVPGVEEYLMGTVTTHQPLRVMVNQQASFDLIPAGVPIAQSSELLEAGMGPFLSSLEGAYDVIVLDLPPVLGFADSVTVGHHCAGVLLCTGVSTESRSALEAIGLLRRSQARVVGAILTGTRIARQRVVEAPKSPRGGGFPSKGSDQGSAARDRNPVVRVRQR